MNMMEYLTKDDVKHMNTMAGTPDIARGTQNGDLSENNSLPTDCTRNENKSCGEEIKGSHGDKKDKGCVYCKQMIAVVKMDFETDSMFGEGKWLSSTRQPNYCPMCGRKL